MIAELIFLAAVFLHLWLCPYTKVEESFNMQAFHDILYRGVQDIQQYDHHQFPGVVPRTFIGPLLISALSYPFLAIVRMLKVSETLGMPEKLLCQYIVRGVLGLVVYHCMLKFCHSVTKVFGYSVTRLFLLITASQFHLVFYSSRSLPNTFALALTLVAIAHYLNQEHHKFVVVATFNMVVFRGELALLFGPFVLMELLQKRLSIVELLKWGIMATVISLALTVGVDSYFWQRRAWPEGEVLWFNTILNKSGDWGTSPFLWYFYSALPRVLMTSIAFIPIGGYLDVRMRRLIMPALIFVVLFSNLPHKELRFIFYALPLFNLAAAVGCDRVLKNRYKGTMWIILSALVFWQFVINILGTSVFLYISHDNYPGAKALMFVHALEDGKSDIRVHIDPFTAQTGVTQFLQYNDKWTYDKSESLLPTSSRMVKKMNYALAGVGDDKERTKAKWESTHASAREIKSFHNLTIDFNTVPPYQVNVETKIILFHNRKFMPKIQMGDDLGLGGFKIEYV